jgi:hypothetical protein
MTVEFEIASSSILEVPPLIQAPLPIPQPSLDEVLTSKCELVTEMTPSELDPYHSAYEQPIAESRSRFLATAVEFQMVRLSMREAPSS